MIDRPSEARATDPFADSAANTMADLDRKLDHAIASLPREQAGIGFTTRVMANLEPTKTPSGRPWLMVLASAALLLVMVALGRQQYLEHQEHQALARIASLRAEQQAIENELSQLRKLTDEARPVLYLGSEHEVDLVFDLGQLRRGDRLALPEHLKRGLGVAAAGPGVVRREASPAVYASRGTY